jgi:hypothetical protein
LQLDPATGAIRGTPSGSGEYRFTIEVRDSELRTSQQEFVIGIESKLAITTDPELPSATLGSPYSYNVFASGMNWPHRWAIAAGELPAGLVLDSASGMVRGTPEAPGSFRFTMEVTDAAEGVVRSDFVLKVISGLALATRGELPGGIVGRPYRYGLRAHSGAEPYFWSVMRGSLPPGLALNSRTGEISGVARDRGSHEFTVAVSDASEESAIEEFSLTVSSGLTITTPRTLPAAVVDRPYEHTLSADAGKPPYRWSVTGGRLPMGLSVNSDTGKVGGVPMEPGTNSFTVGVTDSAGATASRSLEMEVRQALTITSAPGMAPARVGASYLQQLQVRGGSEPYRWSLVQGQLPPGVAMDPASGSLGGAPTRAGVYRFSLRVQDAGRTADTREFTLGVAGEMRIASSQELPGGVMLSEYSADLLAENGLPPYSWSVVEGQLPEA